jgi:hypothetical protein
MAAFLSAVQIYIDSEYKSELHICEDDDRRCLHDHITHMDDFPSFLTKLETVYRTTREQKTDSGQLTIEYHIRAASTFHDLVRFIGPVCYAHCDLIALFNVYVHCVYVYGQRDLSDTVTVNETQPVALLPETDRGLLALGGGTIGDIWRVSRRRKARTDLSQMQVCVCVCARAHVCVCVCVCELALS